MSNAKRPMINQALRLARLYWGYSQSELAEMLGVSQSIVSEVENATKSVSMDLLEKYAEVLGVSMANLLFFADELKDIPDPIRRKTIIATKVLEFLDGIAPQEKAGA